MGARSVDRKKECLLVVDDDQQVGEVLCELISALGFPCERSTSGHDALNKLENKACSILLADMRMPEMSGFELIRIAREKYPDLNIIAMTGYIEEFRFVDIINSGADDFIKKPIDAGELEAKLIRNITERNLRKKLSRLSITDSLTDLFNRREFYVRLKREILRSVRQKHPLGLILVDLDNFKAYNDRHGHVAGDAVLRSVGRAINKSIREGVDTGYRYGGDEFAVILIDSDLTIAEEIGKRIQQAVIDETGLVSASVGYAMYSDRMSLTEFVCTADSDLYKAKDRNRPAAGYNAV
ncbi:MAG: diguanylate cyclase [Candidatus Desulfacyla sp.]